MLGNVTLNLKTVTKQGKLCVSQCWALSSYPNNFSFCNILSIFVSHCNIQVFDLLKRLPFANPINNVYVGLPECHTNICHGVMCTHTLSRRREKKKSGK